MTPSTELDLIAAHLSASDTMTARAISAVAASVRAMEIENARMQVALDEYVFDARRAATLMVHPDVVDFMGWRTGR